MASWLFRRQWCPKISLFFVQCFHPNPSSKSQLVDWLAAQNQWGDNRLYTEAFCKDIKAYGECFPMWRYDLFWNDPSSASRSEWNLGLSDLKFGCSVAEKTESSWELGIGVFFAGFPKKVPEKNKYLHKRDFSFSNWFPCKDEVTSTYWRERKRKVERPSRFR